MNAGSRSTSTTSTDESHMRRYFAAVAPPKPPPITTTRALEGAALPAQPAREAAAAALRKSLRFISASLFLLRGEPGRQRIDLRVGITLGDLVHDGRRPLAVAERPHLVSDVLARQSGERNHRGPGRNPAFGAVADGAAGGEVARLHVLGCDRTGDESEGENCGCSHHVVPPCGERGAVSAWPASPVKLCGARASSTDSRRSACGIRQRSVRDA